MIPNITVLATPDVWQDRDLSGYAAAVIDVLRATSSIASALSSGCEKLIPAKNRAEALAKKEEYPGAILAGEEGGLKIEGFDLGNSPSEFTRENVGGKTVVMTTSNGTRAILGASDSGASPVLTCSFLNLDAVARGCASACQQSDTKGLAIFCSGSHGEFSLEDFACAGALAKRVMAFEDFTPDPAARAAISLWDAYRGDSLQVIEDAPHGRQLIELGFGEDVKHCAAIGALDVVPRFQAGMIARQA